MKRILFLVNGYGLGNSSRIHGIIQHINKDYVIDIFAYENSLKYFKQIPRIQHIHQGFSMEYGVKNGKIDFFSTMGKMFGNLRVMYKNRQHIKKILKSQRYNLIVSDSDFSTLFLQKRPKLISINNANIILKKALQISKKGCYMQFFTEIADYIYNFFVPDLIICPFFQSFKDTKKIRHTSLIVRKEFHRSRMSSYPPKRHHILVMTGGANVFTRGIFIDWDQDDYDLSVLASEIELSGKAKRENKTFNTSDLIDRSTILVINGGFSSISEALAMAKPMVVIPLKGHIEQKVNALWVKENKMGLISSWDNLKTSIFRVKENYTYFREQLLNYNRLDGAKQAASLIVKELGNDIMR